MDLWALNHRIIETTTLVIFNLMNGKEKSVSCSCLPSDMKVCSAPLKILKT